MGLLLEIKDLKIEFDTFEGVSHVLEEVHLTLEGEIRWGL
jgi:ABC-type antimicrobial peptide transport system ATPase subunit